MKKLSILLFALFSVATAKAQLRKMSLFAGGGFLVLKQKPDDAINKYNTAPFSYKFGIDATFNLKHNGKLTFIPSIDLTKFTLKKEIVTIDDNFEFNTLTYLNKMNYLTIRAPVGIGNSESIVFLVGPYFAYLLPSKQKMTNEVYPQYNTTRQLILGSDKNDDFQKTDIGFTMGITAKLGPMYFGGIMDYGLKNISPKKDEVIKKRNFYAVIGIYLFNKDK